MIAVMLFGVILTLAGQPESFWQHPEMAIRGDGLPIGNATNQSFEFFLGSGWPPFLLANLIYFAAAFLLVSIIPRKVALIAIFSFIFGHYFGGTNWLAVRWHLGSSGSGIYALLLAPILVFSAFPKPGPNTDRIIKALAWVMVGVMSFDMTNTLLGQPAGYWQHPETAHEGNSFSRWLLIHGWYTFLFTDLVFFFGLSRLVSILPRAWALSCIFYFILVNYIGASNWFFYQWRLGVELPLLYGILLSVIIVTVSLRIQPLTSP